MIAREHWLPVYDFGNYGSSVFSNSKEIFQPKYQWVETKVSGCHTKLTFAEVIMLGNWHMPMWSRKAEMCLEK